MRKKLILTAVFSITLGSGALFSAHAGSTPENSWQRDRASYQRETQKVNTREPENTWQRDRATYQGETPKVNTREPGNTWQRDRANFKE